MRRYRFEIELGLVNLEGAWPKQGYFFEAESAREALDEARRVLCPEGVLPQWTWTNGSGLLGARLDVVGCAPLPEMREANSPPKSPPESDVPSPPIPGYLPHRDCNNWAPPSTGRGAKVMPCLDTGHCKDHGDWRGCRYGRTALGLPNPFRWQHRDTVRPYRMRHGVYMCPHCCAQQEAGENNPEMHLRSCPLGSAKWGEPREWTPPKTTD